MAQWLRICLQCRGRQTDPWSGRSHVPRSSEAWCTATTEAMLQSRHAASPEPPCCSSWSLHAQSRAQPPEKPPPWEGAQPRRAAPLTTARERLCTAVMAQQSQKSTSDWKNNCDVSMQWRTTEYASQNTPLQHEDCFEVEHLGLRRGHQWWRTLRPMQEV